MRIPTLPAEFLDEPVMLTGSSQAHQRSPSLQPNFNGRKREGVRALWVGQVKTKPLAQGFAPSLNAFKNRLQLVLIDIPIIASFVTVAWRS